MIDFTSPSNQEPHSLAQHQVIRDYVEYSRQPSDEVVQKVVHHRHMNQENFHALGADFYSKSDTYIYDILSGNPSIESRTNLINRFIPGCVKSMVDHPGTDIADFGGGVGVFCEIAKRATGKNTTYIDLKSHMADFALWRFKKYQLDINVVFIPEDNFELPQQYDIIFTDAVWEHLPVEKQLPYLTKLMSYLREDGLFFFLIDLSGHTPDMPMHFPVNIYDVHNHLRTLGMQCKYGNFEFASMWHKKV